MLLKSLLHMYMNFTRQQFVIKRIAKQLSYNPKEFFLILIIILHAINYNAHLYNLMVWIK